MGITITLIDHHIIPDPEFIHHPKLTLLLGYDYDNYYNNIRPHINRPFDYVFMDENPDAMLAATMYLLSREKPPQFKCLPRALEKSDFTKLRKGGKNNVVFFNCLWAYNSAFDEVDSIVLINPHESGLQNISASQIIYQALENPTSVMRDLAGIATVMDYTIDVAFEIIVDIANAYPDIFSDLLEMIKHITLNKYNVHDTTLGEISAMFRAPSILYGVKGVDSLVKSFVENPDFSLKQLAEGDDVHSIKYLRSCVEKYKEILQKEFDLFDKEKEEHGVVIMHTPQFKSQNFVREFANRIKDQNINSIIMIKTPTPDKKMKYSIRRGELNIDLGATLEKMGIGGGNPFAAGCTVSEPGSFEKAFFEIVEKAGF